MVTVMSVVIVATWRLFPMDQVRAGVAKYSM